jgi:undecaprenyl diphosphate synthase
MGHKYGAETADKLLDWCIDLEIPQLSIWVGSTENLTARPRKEVKELLKVYYNFFKRWEDKQPIFDKYEIKVRFVGDLNRLPKKLLRVIGRIMQKTAKYQKKFLNIMINYGGQLEMLNVMKKIAEQVIKLGKVRVSKRDVEKNLWVQTPVDLIIRTGGKSRLSNFAMWQASYAEMYVTKTLWPDFSKKELIKAIKWYNQTQRNFGR